MTMSIVTALYVTLHACSTAIFSKSQNQYEYISNKPKILKKIRKLKFCSELDIINQSLNILKYC